MVFIEERELPRRFHTQGRAMLRAMLADSELSLCDTFVTQGRSVGSTG